jgi:hypothetical protein
VKILSLSGLQDYAMSMGDGDFVRCVEMLDFRLFVSQGRVSSS